MLIIKYSILMIVNLLNYMSNIIELKQKEDKDNVYSTIGNNIASIRKMQNMTQSKIAEKLGVSPQQVQKYEAGKSAMYVHTLIEIAKIFNVTIEKLINIEEQGVVKKFGNMSYFRDSED